MAQFLLCLRRLLALQHHKVAKSVLYFLGFIGNAILLNAICFVVGNLAKQKLMNNKLQCKDICHDYNKK